MAERVLQQTVVIAAGTPIASPATTALNFGDWEVEAVGLDVPPGSSGNVGFYLANNGNPWIPRTPGEWIVWDDRHELFYATNYPAAGGWQLVGYNLGQFAHDVVVRFHVNPLRGPRAARARFVLTFVQSDVPERETVVL